MAQPCWVELDRFQGDADDFGLHRGGYYDISDLAGPETRIRFRAAPGLGGQDEVFFDNVTVQAWRDTGIRVPEVLYELTGGRVWRHIPARNGGAAAGGAMPSNPTTGENP